VIDLAKKSQFYDRDPYPKVQSGTIASGAEATIDYQNKEEEISEVKRIQIDAPPLVTATVWRDDDGQPQVVQTAIAVQDLPTYDGHSFIEFRRVERDTALNIRKSQKIFVVLANPYGFTVSYFVVIDKNALRFYTLLEEAEVAAPLK
jgi:hypothetical protein